MFDGGRLSGEHLQVTNPSGILKHQGENLLLQLISKLLSFVPRYIPAIFSSSFPLAPLRNAWFSASRECLLLLWKG
jgi:hypothetical protein